MADKILAIDIETNGLLSQLLDYSSFPYKLLPTAKLHYVVVNNVETGETHSAEKEKVTKEWLKSVLSGCTHLVAHNGLKFDFITLKLFGVLDYRVGYLDEPDTIFNTPVQLVDTLLLSRLLSPDRYTPEGAGHSLEVWGERLGEQKQDYRADCIEAGYIDKDCPKGSEFLEWTPLLLGYCKQDTKVTSKLFRRLWSEYLEYLGWKQAFKMESKLADLAVRREHLGFYFDVEKAKECVADLQGKMKAIASAINPILPTKPRNKGELAAVTPPKNQFKTHDAVFLPKVQIKKDGTLSSSVVKFLTKQEEIEYAAGSNYFVFNGRTYELPFYEALVEATLEPSEPMFRFVERVGATIDKIEDEWLLFYKGQMYNLPYHEPLETHTEPNIDDIDHVKNYLIRLGWNPTEFRVRDLTKDAKKQSISYETRLAALQRYVKETLEDGKYKEHRLEILGLTEHNLFDVLAEKIKGNRPVIVPTSPCVRVGVEKELCPNLTKLGDKVAFAKDFALYLTYKHRKNSIAGGISEDWEYDEENPPGSGYLKQYREVDGRIPTPAIECATPTARMKHIGVANIPRATSVYGKEMRSLFCAGKSAYFFGYDHSSLESRTGANYIYKYEKGEQLAIDMIAEKPNSIHCKNAVKLGISRSDAKSFTFGIMFGAQIPKLAKMLGITVKKATELYEEFWNNMPALKQFKTTIEKYWLTHGKVSVPALDKRKIFIRSQHSIVNAAIQSAGALCSKYTSVFLMNILEKKGLCTDPFLGEPDCCQMIIYHDEEALYVNKKFFEIKKFLNEEEAKQFVSEWKGNQLSPVSHINNWYVVMPNVISESIIEALKKTEEILNLRVPLAIEWKVGRNWYNCH